MKFIYSAIKLRFIVYSKHFNGNKNASGNFAINSDFALAREYGFFYNISFAIGAGG